MKKNLNSKSTPNTKNPISTLEIEIALAKHFGVQKNIIVPNISYGFDGMHECDLFIVSKSGYVSEIEIKISKADFLKDLNKKHQHIDKQNRINKFYYVMPNDIYLKVKDLIPINAGIIICTRELNYKKKEYISVHIEREAKKIKDARKLTFEEQFKICRLGTMRIFNLKTKYLSLLNKKSN